ncbi:MAG: hypothetical protein ACREDG_04075 [Methylocella sp.]
MIFNRNTPSPSRPAVQTTRTTSLFADYRQSFRADAAQDAWLSMQAWFKKYDVLS